MNQAVYITKEVQENISMDIVFIMLEMIKEINVKRDYLQVFQIEALDEKTAITISQEIPSYEKSILIDWVAERNKMKLFYIDNVLMMADEY